MAQALPAQILALIGASPGLTDREIADSLRGRGSAQQPVNQAARLLAAKSLIERRRRHDGLIGNYLCGSPPIAQSASPIAESTLLTAQTAAPSPNHDVDALSEDELKRVLAAWLVAAGWSATTAWGKERGIDIEARRGSERWVIEVKGPGSRPPMRVNYFISILGETLQRMDEAGTRYSIALPDVPQFRRLWQRLPTLAKQRTQISAMFVSKTGEVDVVS